MSDLTDYLKYKQRSKWVYIGAGVIVVVLLFALFKGCQNSKEQLAQDKVDKEKYATLNAKVAADSIQRKAEKERTENIFSTLMEERAEAQQKVDSSARLLSNIQGRVAKLIDERNMYREALPDSSWVLVHPAYADECDSCFSLLSLQKKQGASYQEDIQNLNIIKDRELFVRDSTLAEERKAYIICNARTQAYRQLYESSSKVNQPHNKFYLTATAISDLTQFGYGGGGTLATKKGKIYSVKIGQMNKRTFYQVEAGFLLSFRK